MRNQRILGRFGLPSEDPAPSFLFVVFDDPPERDRVRGGLVGQGIYPSALWPMELPVSDAARSLAARSFAIPLDGRMTEALAHRVAGLLHGLGVRAGATRA